MLKLNLLFQHIGIMVAVWSTPDREFFGMMHSTGVPNIYLETKHCVVGS
jgi:hypothetical protein